MLVIFLFIVALAIQFGVVYNIEKKKGNKKFQHWYYYILSVEALIMLILSCAVSPIVEHHCIVLSEERFIKTYTLEKSKVEEFTDEDDEFITIVLEDDEITAKKSETFDQNSNTFTISVYEYDSFRKNRTAKAFWLYDYLALVKDTKTFNSYYIA